MSVLAPATAGPVTSFVRRRPLTAFLLWFFTVGQAFAFVPVLVDVPYPQVFIDLSTVVGLLLPALAITWIVDGPDALRALLRSAFRWRVAPRWYVLVLVTVPTLSVALALAVGGAPHGVQELLLARRLDEVAGRARLDGRQDVLLLAARRQHQHPGRVRDRREPPGDLDAGQVGKVQVEDDDVGAGRRADAQRLAPLARGRHHVVARLGEVAGHGVAPHRVVVHHHHPRSRHVGNVRRAGSPRLGHPPRPAQPRRRRG